MKTSRTIVWISFVLVIVSLTFYLLPVPALVLEAEQLNELLLAVFGAGVGSFSVGIIEYCSQRNELENKLFDAMEPLISALAGLKECVIESISGVKDPRQLILDFYTERSSSKFRSAIFPDGNVNQARDRLVRAIEGCSLDECDKYFNDEGSLVRRYLKRFESNLEQSVDSYLNLGNKLACVNELQSTVRQLAYLFFGASRKTKKGQKINDRLIAIVEHYDSVIGSCRIYKHEDYGSENILNDITAVESTWIPSHPVSIDGNEINIINCDAYGLFVDVSEFAKTTHSNSSIFYRGIPWWCWNPDICTFGNY